MSHSLAESHCDSYNNPTRSENIFELIKKFHLFQILNSLQTFFPEWAIPLKSIDRQSELEVQNFRR